MRHQHGTFPFDPLWEEKNKRVHSIGYEEQRRAETARKESPGTLRRVNPPFPTNVRVHCEDARLKSPRGSAGGLVIRRPANAPTPDLQPEFWRIPPKTVTLADAKENL
jgi:hypothetical protein